MSFSPDFSRRYEKLPVTIFKEQPEASKLILDAIIAKCNEKAKEGKKCVLALAASSACIQIYDDMVKAYEAGKLSFKSIEIFSMDEYYPLDRNELQSHYRFFKEYIFDLVDIPQENIHCLPYKKNLKWRRAATTIKEHVSVFLQNTKMIAGLLQRYSMITNNDMGIVELRWY